jgi:hypothetical protein
VIVRFEFGVLTNNRPACNDDSQDMVVAAVQPELILNMSADSLEKLALRITFEGVAGTAAESVMPHGTVSPAVML